MWLILNPGLLDERVLPLPEGAATIGRTEDNTVCVLHTSLSRRHARLEREGVRVTLVDLGSKNGTFVDEARVERRELRAGDAFRCGEVRFKLMAARAEVAPLHVQELRTRLLPASVEELVAAERVAGSTSALKVRSAEAKDTRAAGKLQVLLKVSQLLSSPGPIDGLLERILQLVFQTLEVDRAALLLVDPASGMLNPRVARLATGEVPPGTFYSQHIAEYVRQRGLAALFADAREDPRLEDATSVVLQSIRASMCAPLKARDEVLGVLYVDNVTRAHGFSEEGQVVDLLNEYFPVMAEIVFRYEGTLEKYIGDALMAVWGAPFSQPDDADRAVRAAVEMQRALEELNARWRTQGRPELQIHVGLNTGRAAAGNIGSEHYLQYATLGDATNVASRICTAAGPGEVCLAEATLQRCQERPWPVAKLPPVHVRGKEEALTLYRVDWRDVPVP